MTDAPAPRSRPAWLDALTRYRLGWVARGFNGEGIQDVQGEFVKLADVVEACQPPSAGVTVVYVQGQEGKPVAAPCCLSGCQYDERPAASPPPSAAPAWLWKLPRLVNLWRFAAEKSDDALPGVRTVWAHCADTLEAAMPPEEEPSWFPNEGDRQYWRERHASPPPSAYTAPSSTVENPNDFQDAQGITKGFERTLQALSTVASPPPSAAPAWQPIATVPTDGTRMLTWYPKSLLVAIGRREADGRWYGPGGEEPTHWMPLPAPPSAGPSPADREST